MRWIFAILSFWAACSPAIAAELVVFVDGPARPAIKSVAHDFESRTGDALIFIFAPGPALNKRVADGERADVIITPKRYIDELQTASRAISEQAQFIGSTGVSLAIRKGGVAHDVSTIEALKTALLKAEAIVLNNVASGNQFTKMIERLELPESIAGKIVRMTPDAVFDRVAKSNAAEIAVGTTTLVLEDSRLQTLGALPPEFQSRVDLFAVPLTGAKNREGAEALVAYLTAPDTRKRLAAAGLQ